MQGTPETVEPDFEALCEDLPVSIKACPNGNQVMIGHFKSHKEGEGYAKEALQRIEETAVDAKFDKIMMNIGRNSDKDVVGWLEYMGFVIVERLLEPDHITAYKEL